MHLTRKKRKSDAEKSGLSGENSECPGNPETPRISPDSPGFQHISEKTDFHSFSIYHKVSLESKNRVDHHKHTTKCLKLT
jgi:hypothetical protein